MNKGQALLFALFLLLVIGIFSGTLAVIWHSEINIRYSERDSLVAFYMAQAGIEEAKIWVRHNPDCGAWGSSSYESGWVGLGTGRYCFIVQDLGGGSHRLYSRGQKLDSAGNVIAERQVRVDVTAIENPFTNSSDDRQVSWSWQEI